MNFNIKYWNFINYAAYFIFLINVPNPFIGIFGGYVFASTFGEMLHKFTSRKSSEAFAKKHNLKYNPKSKSYEKQ